MTLKWRIFAAAALGIPLIAILVVMVGIYRYADESDTAPADAALVLGTVVWRGQPSPVFEERIKHAIDLYQSKRVRVIIFTGGIRKGSRLAESEVARRYALQRGVAAGAVFCEGVSTTTYENIREARPIIDRERIGRVLIVSDPLHMKRAVTMARFMAIDAYPSPTPTTRYVGFQSRAVFLLQETIDYSAYMVQRMLGLAG